MTFDQESEDVKKRVNYSLSVISRIKKSLESTKENVVMENKLSVQQSASQSKERDRVIIPRSASTIKLAMQSNKELLGKDNAINFNLTAKLSTAKKECHNTGPFALRDVSNRMH